MTDNSLRDQKVRLATLIEERKRRDAKHESEMVVRNNFERRFWNSDEVHDELASDMLEHICALHEAIKPLAALADAIDRCYEGGVPCADDAMAGVIEYGQAAKLRELLRKAGE